MFKFLLIFLTPSLAFSQDWKEIDWSKHLAKQVGGVPEYQLPDGSRVDIYVTGEEYDIAYEVEHCSKWKESIGQALFYTASLDNHVKPCRPGIWLLMKSEDDEDYLRCLTVIRELKSKGFPIILKVEKFSNVRVFSGPHHNPIDALPAQAR